MIAVSELGQAMTLTDDKNLMSKQSQSRAGHHLIRNGAKCVIISGLQISKTVANHCEKHKGRISNLLDQSQTTARQSHSLKKITRRELKTLASNSLPSAK